ncbi:MAG: hypothetical protein PHG66_00695 [Candidatus Colwellbacteria bacterium]|nr:hypothetical protein [Candidatus Colwellbacteria bacterium]
MPKYNIDNLLEYAEQNEGELLSEKYTNTTFKYEWRCKKNHVFSLSWESCMRYDTWCKLCKHKVGLDVLIECATNKGGKCLSKTYERVDSSYEWECSNGHLFDRTFISIRDNNHWCNECKESSKLQEMTDFVKNTYGDGNSCLSKEYFDNETMYEWRCNKNHTFQTTWISVKRDYWCHECRFNTGIDELQKFAATKGGKLISTEYNRILDEYKWECCKGHTFIRKWQHVRKDVYWCRECDNDIIFDEMKKYASDNGGELLTETYTQSSDKYRWKCENNHVWTRTWTHMKHYQNWCYRCNCWNLEDIQAVAESRGEKCIECISGKGISGRYLWMCYKGHTFETSGSIVYESKCAQCNKLSIEEMKQLAIGRGGECLSNVYINGRIPLKWRCCRGHEWEALPKHVKSNTWCRQCSFENITKSKSEHRDDIEGDDIVKCSNGHILPFGSINVKDDEWCGLCRMSKTRYNNALKAIDRCKGYLSMFGGKLLSTDEEILKNCETKIFRTCPVKVGCKNKHEWETSLDSLSQGHWCTKCKWKSEAMAVEIMEEITNKKFIKKRPAWLQKLELDGYCEELKLAIEYNGIQHSMYSDFFHKNIRNFESQKARDLLKQELCVKHGVMLISVPFNYNMKNRESMYEFIKSELSRLNPIEKLDTVTLVPIIFEDDD